MKVIVLAAGCSQRMGQTKQLLTWHGKTMLQHCLDKLQNCDLEIILVLGANANTIKSSLDEQYHIVENKNWAAGMGSSIALGMDVLSDKDSAIMIMLADQPAITETEIHQLVSNQSNNPNQICCSCYQQKLSAPAIFPKQYFSELANLSENKGAKSILNREADVLTKVAMPNTLININTADDWNHWLNQITKQQDILEDTNHEIYAE